MATPWSKSEPQIGPIPVREGSVEIFYANSERQIEDLSAEIDRWEESIEGNPGPMQRDSLDLARYGIRRWQESHAEKQTAKSVKRLKEMIEDNPRSEVRVLVVARANWRRTQKIVGLCTFRRTWCRNINLEVIAAHPALDEMKNSPISGLGTGLLHHVCSVAEIIDSDAIWGECTQNSAKFYSLFVDQPIVQDLIILRRSDYVPLKDKIGRKWQEK
jgi:hypothetical protein